MVSERRAAAGMLAMIMACGFADGDPIVTGGTTAAATDPTLATGTQASTTDVLTTGPDGTADGLDTGSGSGSGEDTGTTLACACEGREPGDRCLRFINECEQPIRAGASGLEEPAGAFDALSQLDPQACVAVAVREVAMGRAWGGTGCVDDVCAGDGNAGRGSLVQLNLPAEGTDFYDVSLVDGFNVPMAMIPVSAYPSTQDEPCRPASCAADLTVVCPDELLRYDDDGAVAYCASTCRACDPCLECDDCADPTSPACRGCGAFAEFCCTGQACEANEHTMLWKSLCPDAITHPEDAGARTCTQQPDYDIVFCP
jgi:hypothetical protein